MDITLADPHLESAAPSKDASTDDAIQVRGADVGDGWIQKIQKWLDEHDDYPIEAIRRRQHGTVKFVVRIDHEGHVKLVRLEAPSGSQWLDAGALALFRGQTVPSLPPDVSAREVEIDVTIHYIMGGG